MIMTMTMTIIHFITNHNAKTYYPAKTTCSFTFLRQ